MHKSLWSRSLLVSVVVAASPALAQMAEKAKASPSIAGKASADKAQAAKVAPERKRYEFTAAGTAGSTSAAQSSTSQSGPSAPAAAKDKSHCHSSGSDA
jgi:hypothetical protein